MEASGTASQVPMLQLKIRQLERECEESRDRADMLQNLLDNHVHALKQREVANPQCPSPSVPGALRLPPEASNLPNFFQQLLKDWVAEMAAVPHVVTQHVAANYISGHVAAMEACMRAHHSTMQEDTRAAAVICMHFMWTQGAAFIRQWLRTPEVFAAVQDNMRMHNASFPQRTISGLHRSGLAGLQLSLRQAHGLAAAAQSFLTDTQLLRRQRAGCLAALSQGHARQAVSSAGTGPSSCSLAVLEDRLLALRGAEQQLYTRTCDVLWAPKGLLGLAGYIMCLRLQPARLDLCILCTIVLDQWGRLHTPSATLGTAGQTDAFQARNAVPAPRPDPANPARDCPARQQDEAGASALQEGLEPSQPALETRSCPAVQGPADSATSRLLGAWRLSASGALPRKADPLTQHQQRQQQQSSRTAGHRLGGLGSGRVI